MDATSTRISRALVADDGLGVLVDRLWPRCVTLLLGARDETTTHATVVRNALLEPLGR